MSITKICRQAKIDFLLWLTNPRMSVFLIVFVLIHSVIIKPLGTGASDLNTEINILEPLAALFNSPLIMLVLPISFIVLIADFPRLDSGFLLQIHRAGRRNWILGEALTLFHVAAFYMAIISCATLVLSLTIPHTANEEWSKVTTEYSMIMGDRANPLIVALLPKNIYKQMSPFSAVILSCILLFGYLVLMGVIMLFATSIRIKAVGIAINVASILAGTGLAVLASELMWILPCAHALSWAHYTEYFREPVLSPYISVVYFGVLIGSFLLLSTIFIRKRDFDSTQEFD